MSSPELENLVAIGTLKREPRSQREFDTLVGSARARLSDAASATWRVLAKAHTQRNLLEYEGSGDIDERLVTDLINAAREVERAVSALGG